MTEIESPCVNVCVLNAEAVCVGCGRSIDEIAEWGQASEARRGIVVEAARERLARLKPSLVDAP